MLKWHSTRESQNYNVKASNKKKKNPLKKNATQVIRDGASTPLEMRRESEKLFAGRTPLELTNFHSQYTAGSGHGENVTPGTNSNISPLKKHFSS